MASNVEQIAAVLTASSMGYSGSKVISGTSAVTPVSGFKFVAIQFMEDSEVTTQTDGTHATTDDGIAVVNATLNSFMALMEEVPCIPT